MFDLTTPKDVEDYLAQTAFAATSVVPFTGGNVNFTYRITLCRPLTAAGLDGHVPSLVLKHAEPHMSSNNYKDIDVSVERQRFESLAFQVVPDLVEPLSIVSLPRLYHEDREHGVVIMSDSGPECRTLQDTLKSGPLPDDVAQNIGVELGAFLARLHTATRDPASGSPAHAAKNAFEANHQARTLTASIFYDNIVSTFTKDPPLFSPPLHLPHDVLIKLQAISLDTQKRICTRSDVLNMGDFRPANLLVVLGSKPHVTVIDWESARPGLAGIDIGQFLAELYHLRVSHPASHECINNIISAFMSTYRKITLQSEDPKNAEQFLSETARDTATHMGAFLILLMSHFGETQLAPDAVKFIIHSSDEDDSWLKNSIVGGLLRNLI